MTTVAPIRQTCLLCGTDSEQEALTSTGFYGNDLDGRPHGGSGGWHHSLELCTGCGYVAEEISRCPGIAPASAREILAGDGYRGVLGQEGLPEVARRALARAFFEESIPRPGTWPRDTSRWWKMAAWACDEVAEMDEHRLLSAFRWVSEFALQGEGPADSKARLAVLAVGYRAEAAARHACGMAQSLLEHGDLLRRAGGFDKAVLMARAALSLLPPADTDGTGLQGLARELALAASVRGTGPIRVPRNGMGLKYLKAGYLDHSVEQRMKWPNARVRLDGVPLQDGWRIFVTRGEEGDAFSTRHDLRQLPDGLEIDGSLSVDYPVRKLPARLTVRGALTVSLHDEKTVEIPADLRADSLGVRSGVHVGFPDSFSVPGNLSLTMNRMRSWAPGLTVGRNLKATFGLHLETLRGPLSVGGNADFTNSLGLRVLGGGIEVKGDLDLTGCPDLGPLPADLRVGRRLLLDDTYRWPIPDGLRAGEITRVPRTATDPVVCPLGRTLRCWVGTDEARVALRNGTAGGVAAVSV